MTRPDLFRDQPVLTGELVRLVPLTESVLEDYLAALADPEVRRLTGSHGPADPARARQWLASRVQQHDRADWAVLRRSDGTFLGEAVLNDLDPDNASANYRILLAGPRVFGKGYGAEVTRLVLDYAFATGLHRVSLGVFDFNPRARRVYEKCGFQLEGRLRHALRWEGQWHDELVMAALSTDPRPLVKIPPSPAESGIVTPRTKG
ncbi:MAG: GNAT family protein [Jatrophihabitantaceae bacterium]